MRTSTIADDNTSGAWVESQNGCDVGCGAPCTGLRDPDGVLPAILLCDRLQGTLAKAYGSGKRVSDQQKIEGFSRAREALSMSEIAG
jgi:hypothetical protein